MGPNSRRDGALEDERQEEVLNAWSGFGGNAQAIGHLATAGFDFERHHANKVVSRQLAQNSNSSLGR